jgi:hypothetical protein
VVEAGDNSKKIYASSMSNSEEIRARPQDDANGILLQVGSKRLFETSAHTNLNLGARIPLLAWPLIEVKL